MAAAEAKYQAALKIDPKYVPALIGMAGVAQTRNDRTQVENYLQQAEKASPKGPEVHVAWGRYYLRNNEPSRAEKSFLRAREFAPSAIPPLLELGDLYLRTRRPKEALTAYRDAVKLDGGNRFAQYGLGVAAAANGERDEAFRALGRAAELAPKDPAPHRAIGRLHFEAGNLDQALAAFDAGLARQPRFVPLMLDKAEVLERQKKVDEALAQYAAAEKLAPKSAEILVRKADTYQRARRWDEAETAYQRAIALEPKSPLAYNNLAWMTVERQGDAKKAVEWARKAVELSPRSSPLLDTLGWAQRAAGDLAGAQSSLKRAIELEPKVALYHLHLGLVQRDMKDAPAARRSFERAVELAPSSPDAEQARRALKELPPA
jgi:tetratricopeptide (TPR) repeat protein